MYFTTQGVQLCTTVQSIQLCTTVQRVQLCTTVCIEHNLQMCIFKYSTVSSFVQLCSVVYRSDQTGRKQGPKGEI